MQATRWPWQCLQASWNIVPTLPALRAAGARTLAVYADATVYNPAESTGVRTGLAPDSVDPSWILRSGDAVTGLEVSRAQNGGEYLLDVGNVDYQAASAAFLVAKCRVQGWDGVMLDEVNETYSWGGWSAVPAKYPTDAAWQAAQLSYITAVSTLVWYSGYRCYINYGGSYDTFAKTCLAQVDGSCSQYWVGKNNYGGGPLTLAMWQQDVAWAQYCEQQGTQSLFHVSTADPTVARLALASYLLVSSGNGVFSCAVNDNLDDVYTQDFTNALRLGSPMRPYTTVNGIYTREFQHGLVTVDSAAMAGSITLNS